jgi:FixJ family two-component response regulator
MPRRGTRWREAFDLACRGLTNRAIASRMGTTEKTTRNHLTKAYIEISKQVGSLADYNPRAWSASHRGDSDGLRAAERDRQDDTI